MDAKYFLHLKDYESSLEVWDGKSEDENRGLSLILTNLEPSMSRK